MTPSGGRRSAGCRVAKSRLGRRGVRAAPARALAGALAALAGLLVLLAAGGCAGGSRSAGAEPASARTPAPGARGASDVTIAFSGDLLVHTAVAERAHEYAGGGPAVTAPPVTAAPAACQARRGVPGGGAGYDFRPMLAPVRAQLSAASLAVCHMETPLSRDDRRITGYPTFNVPRELADAVRDAGYDACSTASNHSYDRGMAGIDATLDQLDRVGVAHAGTARTPADAGRLTLLPAGPATVALLDYTFGVNEGQHPPPWAVQIIDAARIRADAARARAAGADLVAVVLHWGQEYETAPTAGQRRLAADLLASPDVDLVTGGHVHVVQPVQRINGKFVVYGVGNFLSNQSAECCPPGSQDGVIETAHVRRDGAGRWSVAAVTFTPTWVDRGPYRVLPVAAALDDPATPEPLRRELSASWRRTVAALGSLGALDPLGPAADADGPAEGARLDRIPRSLAG